MKKFALVTGAGIAAVVAGFGWYWSSSEPTLEEAVANMNQCLNRADGDCLYDYASGEERQALGLTPDKLTNLARDYVLPAYRGLKDDGHPEFREAGFGSGLTVVRHFGQKDGCDLSLTMTVIKTDKGFEASNLVCSLILSAATTLYPEDRTSPVPSWARQIKHDQHRLASLGLAGIYEQGEGLRNWQDWKEYVAMLNERLQARRKMGTF